MTKIRADEPTFHTYKVGMASSVALVEAPDALASVLFYGTQLVNTNAPFMAVVYEENGAKYEGEQFWVAWQFNWSKMSADEQTAAERLIAAAVDSLPLCRVVEQGLSGKVTRNECGPQLP